MIPNLQHIVELARQQHPQAWKDAHTGNPHTEDFIRLVTPMLAAVDARFGLNGKRGNPNDISDDAVNVRGEGPGHNNDGTPCTVIDIIASAGAQPPFTPSNPAPKPSWGVQTGAVESTGEWVNSGTAPAPIPVPQPPAPPTYPSYEALGGDEGGKKITRLLEADYKRAKGGLDGECGTWPHRTNYDFLTGLVPTIEASIAKHQPEWREALNQERMANGLPPITW